jgi:AcrR family transcriptional regulator
MPKIIENPRQTIMDYAREILYTDGYEKLNMRAVAKRSGVSTGTIYNYFPTKHHLIIDMMMEYWEDFLKELDKTDSSTDDFFEKLWKIHLIYNSFVNTFRGVWVRMDSADLSDFPKEDMDKKRSFNERVVKRLSKIITRDLEGHPDIYHLPLSSYELSKFILQNFTIMSQAERLEYEAFETLLRKLVK